MKDGKKKLISFQGFFFDFGSRLFTAKWIGNHFKKCYLYWYFKIYFSCLCCKNILLECFNSKRGLACYEFWLVFLSKKDYVSFVQLVPFWSLLFPFSYIKFYSEEFVIYIYIYILFNFVAIFIEHLFWSSVCMGPIFSADLAAVSAL